MAKIQNNTGSWWGDGATGGRANGTAALEYSWDGSYETTHPPPMCPSDHASWYLPKGGETCVFTRMFVAAAFIIAQSGGVSFSRWMDKLWRIQTMEYYSTLQKRTNKELSSHERQRQLSGIIWSERSQSVKCTDCMIPTAGHSGKGKTVATVRWPGFAGKRRMNRQSPRYLEQWKYSLWFHDAGFMSL